jgi:hypothetical protein
MSTPEDQDRLARIIDGIVDGSAAGRIPWETAALPNSYGVNIGSLRFRIARIVADDGTTSYSLDFPGGDLPTVSSTEQGPLAERLEALYNAAKSIVPDKLQEAEKALGLPEAGG